MKNLNPFLFLFIILFANKTQAQSDSIFKFDTHKNNISIGYDFKKLRKPMSSSGVGSLFIKYEHALTKNIGLGVVSYFYHEQSYNENDQLVYIPNGEILKYNSYLSGYSIMPKINWHFSVDHFKNKTLKKLDIYLGVGIGYGVETEKTDYLMKDEEVIDYSPYVDGRESRYFVATEFNLGVRYYPVKHFGAYFEMGFGVSRSQFGLIYKW